jgi:prolyl oligopeptidase
MSMPPRTEIRPVVENAHGTDFIDNYRWLEGENSDPLHMGTVTPEVAAWTDEQNAHTRARLDALPGRASVEATIRTLMQTTAVSAPVIRGGRWFYSRRERDQDQPVFYWRASSNGPDRPFLDPKALDPTGLTAIEWVEPAPDGRLVAYGSYRSGSENTQLHVIELESGTLVEPPIPGKVQAPQWLPDGSGFIYQNLRVEDDPYSGQVLFHRLGTPTAQDALLHRQFTQEENEALATTWGPSASLSHDGRWLFLGYWVDTQSNDAWLVDFEKFRQTGVIDRVPVSVGETGHITGTVIGNLLYLHTTKGAPKGRLVTVPVENLQREAWIDLIPERADAVMESVAFAHGVIVASYMRQASTELRTFELDGRTRGTVKLPGIGAATIEADEDRTTAYVSFTSFNYPTTIFEIDLAESDPEVAVWAAPSVPVDPTTVEVHQVWYPSKDGTPVSMFLIHPTGFVRDGSAPAIVTGYGGFNISETPIFVPAWFQWFALGGLIAIPNLRGGGEYGDAWHQAGTLDRKQNVFDDFHAALEWLAANRYTCAERTAISGGSNGGLLTGAAVTQRPDLFRAAIVAVPLLDMLRYHLFSMARYWVPEYGSAEDPHQCGFLKAYSPYHRVVEGTAYPAVLLTAGENDSRVHPMHARKMAAALQACTSASSTDHPILLWVDREAGHGQGKPLHLRIRDVVDQRIFIMWQLGLLPDAA